MIASLSACGMSGSGSGASAVDYNIQKMETELDIDSEYAEVIAYVLNELSFGRILLHSSTVVNGNGTHTISDLQSKYHIHIENGEVADLADDNDEIIITREQMASISGNEESDNNQQGKAQEEDNPDEDINEGGATGGNSDTNNDINNDTDPTDNTDNNNEGNSGDDAYGDGSEPEEDEYEEDSYITPEAKALLDSLYTDYNKVNWIVRYSLGDLDGLIVSLAPYYDGNNFYLVVALTNLYNTDLTFSSWISAKGLDGEEVGSVFMYEKALGPAGTTVQAILCDDVPTGELYWEDIDINETKYASSAYWESDWDIRTDENGYFCVDYSLLSDEEMTPGTVSAILVNGDGDIIACGRDGNNNRGTTATGTINYYKKEFFETPTDVAIFANPYGD